MAVYTEVAPEALAEFIGRYDLGRVLDFHGIAEGVENTNYRVDTEKGRFALTLYEKRVATADLPFFLGLMEHLAARGLNCPLPVRDQSGVMLGALAGRPAALVTWLDGVGPRALTAGHCAELGHGLAELHRDGADFALRRKNGLGLENWRPLFERFADGCHAIAPGLQSMIENELRFLENNWPSDLPQGIVHADLFPDNAFFVGDKLSGIIDFYFACNDALAYDLAVCVNAWCFDETHAFVAARCKALVTRYHARRPLTPYERACMPILARGAALRFLLTRAYDWIHTPATALVARKDPMEYVTKLRFHQSVGAHGSRAYGFED